MSPFRPVAAPDVLFLSSVGLMWAAVLAHRMAHERGRRLLGTVAWGAFAAFWVTVAGGYLLESRYFLGAIGAVTVGLSAYVVTLFARGRTLARGDAAATVGPGGRPGMGDVELRVRVTLAFAVMGALFAVFEYLDPVHGVVLGAVATHTAWGLELVGFSPVVGTGTQGYANVVFFRGLPPAYAVSLVSACSGISAMTLFAGLVAATDAPRRRKVLGAVTMVGLIYLLNVVRALFVSGALAGEWFAFGRGVVAAVFGVTDPAVASYYVAEYFVAQTLVIVVLLGVYAALARRFPEAQVLVESLLERMRTDADALVGRRPG